MTKTTTEATAEVTAGGVEAGPSEVNVAERAAKADLTVRNYMLGSVAMGMVPLPLVDLAGITAIQLKMLHALARLYGVPFSRQLGKSAIGSLVGGVAPVAAAPAGVSLAKLLPVAGQVVAYATLPVFAGASTYAVGKVFIQHFESGGTFLTFNADKVRDYFREQFGRGKKLAASAREAQEEASGEGKA